jgi:hypothetical protein
VASPYLGETATAAAARGRGVNLELNDGVDREAARHAGSPGTHACDRWAWFRQTTIAILKAADIARNGLARSQSILFLSFARASVSRVLEAIQYEQKISQELQQRIEVDNCVGVCATANPTRNIKSSATECLLRRPKERSIII